MRWRDEQEEELDARLKVAVMENFRLSDNVGKPAEDIDLTEPNARGLGENALAGGTAVC